MASKKAATDDVLRALRAHGLALPGAHTKSPWPGHLDLAVNDKTFAYLSLPGEPLRVSCKLPRTGELALLLPFCSPTPYGLGKSGWVSADFSAHPPDLAMLLAWLDESYRAQAPKKLVSQLDAGHGARAAAVARSAPTRRARPSRPATATVAKPAKPTTVARAAKAATRPARSRAARGGVASSAPRR